MRLPAQRAVGTPTMALFSLFLSVRPHRGPVTDVLPLACWLLHGDPVRSRGVLERRVEVQREAGIKREGVGCNLNHADLVIDPGCQ